MLFELASERLRISVQKLSVENGEVFEKTRPRTRIAYAQLTRGKRIERHLSGPLKVKDPSQFKLMNRPELRRDALEKVTGKAKYAGDIHPPSSSKIRIPHPRAAESRPSSPWARFWPTPSWMPAAQGSFSFP